jgi:hypothetical protein
MDYLRFFSALSTLSTALCTMSSAWPILASPSPEFLPSLETLGAELLLSCSLGRTFGPHGRSPLTQFSHLCCSPLMSHVRRSGRH